MTTERPPVEDFIADMTDDALAEIIEDIGAEAERLGRMAGQARLELTRRMEERDATVLDTEHWEGKLTPGTPFHEYDGERMGAGLPPLLTAEEMDKVVVWPPIPPPRWDKRYLNELAKRGGRIREVIEDATTTTRGAPKLTLERKEEKA